MVTETTMTMTPVIQVTSLIRTTHAAATKTTRMAIIRIWILMRASTTQANVMIHIGKRMKKTYKMSALIPLKRRPGAETRTKAVTTKEQSQVVSMTEMADLVVGEDLHRMVDLEMAMGKANTKGKGLDRDLNLTTDITLRGLVQQNASFLLSPVWHSSPRGLTLPLVM